MIKGWLSIGERRSPDRWTAWHRGRLVAVAAGAAAALSFALWPVHRDAPAPGAVSTAPAAASPAVPTPQGPTAASVAWLPSWAARAERVGLYRIAERSRSGWPEVERLLESAGIDIDRLLGRFGAVPSGQGGPFVALDGPKPKSTGGDDVIAGLHADNLQKALRSLPLAAPLNQFQLESGFGARVDPFNHRRSVHTGLDFSAPFRSPVYNTGPGVVIYAGPKGDYGKVVEVDHGGGVVTRYAHLHRTMVVRGQRLSAREPIGQLGSTGRSSGPHVHYEVLVNGVAQDPEKFLAIGRSVQAAAVR